MSPHSFTSVPKRRSQVLEFWILAAFMIFFLASCGKGEEGEPDRAKMGEAEKAFEEENYDKAKSSVEYFLAQHPEDVEALYFYAQVLIETGQSSKARENANKILAIDPERAEAKAILGEYHYGRNEFNEALDLSRKALIKNPELQAPYRVIGEIYLRQGKVEQSIKVLLEAHRLKPDDDVETMKRLSAAYIKDGNYKESKMYLDKAMLLNDHTPGIHYNLAAVYINMDNGPKALEHIDRVYQNKCVNSIYKKPKNNLVAEPVGPVKNGFLFFTSP